MSVGVKSFGAILLAAFVSLAGIPVHAQIVSVLDEHGQRVYINLEPRPVPVKSPLTGPDPTKSALPPSAATTAALANRGAQPSGSSLLIARNESHGISPARLEELVQTTAARHNVDPELVRAVMETESGGNPTAVSRKGAMGLMQLMPETALQLGVKSVFSPEDNLEAGVRYLRTLLEHYNGDLDKSLAAYNAGAGAVDRAGGVPQYRETREYVRKVTSNYLGADASKRNALTPMVGPNTGTKSNAQTKSTAGTASATGTNASSGTNVSTATTPATKAPPAAPPPHPMYQTVNEEGRVVWTNF